MLPYKTGPLSDLFPGSENSVNHLFLRQKRKKEKLPVFSQVIINVLDSPKGSKMF